jgi:hypothetical protein
VWNENDHDDRTNDGWDGNGDGEDVPVCRPRFVFRSLSQSETGDKSEKGWMGVIQGRS